MLNKWTFKGFIDDKGINIMDDWYKNEMSTKAQARLDKILEHFRDSPLSGWRGKYFEQLKGVEGIYEIRFIVQNIQYRPLGCFAPTQGDFTFLIGAKEQGDAFVPKLAPELAEKRREIILQNPSRAYECTF
jgi:hypothetical protein